MPDLRFRIVRAPGTEASAQKLCCRGAALEVRAGIPFSAEPVQPSVPSASPPPPLIGPEAEAELFGSKSLEEQEPEQQRVQTG